MDPETPIRERQAFPNISEQTWAHPADQAALATLQVVPGVDVLLQKFMSATSEKSIRSMYLASSVRASQRQFPQLYGLLQEASRILDAPAVPELYVAQHPFFNGGTIGIERPFIVLHSTMLDTLTEDELLCVIGRELGHCLSHRALYKTLLQVLLKFAFFALQVPLSGAAFMGMIAALMEWNRKSELSADRAGLLVVQDPAISYSLLMKMAGGPQANRMDVNEFFVQAAEYEGGSHVFTGLHQFLNIIFASHPFPVMRLTELQTWVNSGAYHHILSQTYRTRTNEHRLQDDILTHLKAASGQYKEQVEHSKDVLTDAMSDVFAGLETWSEQAWQGMESLLDFAAKFDPNRPSSATGPTSTSTQTTATDAKPSQTPETVTDQDVFHALEKLADLKQKGILTDDEFETQKAKLLDRL
jgi:Zn-dependent protease with chaperone function